MLESHISAGRFIPFLSGGSRHLKLLFVAPEAAPFAKVGGLGEVMFSLPRALRNIGYDARVIMPRYASIDPQIYPMKMGHESLMVPTDTDDGAAHHPTHLTCNVKRYEPQSAHSREPVTTYFLENQEYYETRANVYGYADDAMRWALLGRGALEFLRGSDWLPDVIVAADWQSAFVVNYLKTIYRNDPRLRGIATVFSIHNLYYQGAFDHRFVSELDYDAGQAPIPSFYDPRLLKLNMMRRGIIFADVINTVSPTYAQEIMTPQYGEMLDDLLRERRPALYGILNGIDYETVNPAADTYLQNGFDARTIDRRAKNKLQLQDRFGLPKHAKKFVMGVVSRLDEQKGFSLLFDTLEKLIKQFPMQFVVVGSGDAQYMSFFSELSKKYPEHIAAHLNYDPILPHFIFGGADAILVPSKFEPSGLTQMEAMHYGAVPIVRKTGGLADTVEDYDPAANTGTGFAFDDFNGFAMTVAITRAFENWRHKNIWREIQIRGMKKDFSWEHSAREYAALFEKAIATKERVVERRSF